MMEGECFFFSPFDVSLSPLRSDVEVFDLHFLFSGQEGESVPRPLLVSGVFIWTAANQIYCCLFRLQLKLFFL